MKKTTKEQNIKASDRFKSITSVRSALYYYEKEGLLPVLKRFRGEARIFTEETIPLYEIKYVDDKCHAPV